MGKPQRIPKVNVGESTFAFQCRAYKLPDFHQQYRFDDTRQWRADFAWPVAKVMVEIDGGIWLEGGGAHSHPLDIERNMEKQNAAVLLGWRVLRFTPTQVKNGQAIAMTQQLLHATGEGSDGRTD